MLYKVEELVDLIGGSLLNAKPYDLTVKNVIFDTRKASFQEESIFVALQGKSDGHQYIPVAYKHGVRNFLVSQKIDLSTFPEANFIYCADTLSSLQKWATHHRTRNSSPVIAITGSNGKTIVKEWLAQALETKYSVTKSPHSFNSQLGVALSLLNIEKETTISVIEAGISQENEMALLAAMIRPQVGIITNIGDAHSQGFASQAKKLEEKLELFEQSELIIYNKDMRMIEEPIEKSYAQQTVSWGLHPEADLHITTLKQEEKNTMVYLTHGVESFKFSLPLLNKLMIDNCLHVISYLILDNWSEAEIQASINGFSTLPNRMEIKEGQNNCLLINDSYSADLTSTQLALEQLDIYSKGKQKICILSAFEQQRDTEKLYDNLSQLLDEKNISEVVAVGFDRKIINTSSNVSYYPTTQDFLLQLEKEKYQNAAILIKGARKFQFERISNFLEEKVHQTILETNLSAITHNLNVYKARLEESTKLMAVVKAEAYGSGSTQMVQFLQNQKIDYLAVALIDEAVQLRKNGCTLPIMIFNVQEDKLENLWTYDLEPEIYNISILNKLQKVATASAKKLKIHIKLDSGMYRLGFMPEELQELSELLRKASNLEVVSIFSHLAASEQKDKEAFTLAQIKRYEEGYKFLVAELGYKPMRHILNTAGILSYPQAQFEMVRIGLGLYGIDESKTIAGELIRAHSLKARVLQIKKLPSSEATGYNRSGKSSKNTEIAIISLGYADGFMRAAGNGNYTVRIHGQLYPTIGNICMDVTMINLGPDHKVQEGDEVEIFGELDPIEKLANSCNTITYEIISRIAPRVKRAYIYD